MTILGKPQYWLFASVLTMVVGIVSSVWIFWAGFFVWMVVSLWDGTTGQEDK